MSSSNKKTTVGLILLLVFIGAIAAGLMLFNKPEATNNNASEQVASAEIEEDHHGHDHGHDEAADEDAINIGEEGTIHDMAIQPILGRRALGDPNAPIQVQEFFSLTCNHCANFHKTTFPKFKEKYIDTGKVYFIFEELPLNGPAMYGSMTARCLPEASYPGFVSLLLKNQDKWAFNGDFKTNLKQNAALAGMSEEDFETCFANDKLRMEIAMNIQEANKAWGLTSTPSFVFNKGERILSGDQSIESFDAIVELLSGAAETASEE